AGARRPIGDRAPPQARDRGSRGEGGPRIRADVDDHRTEGVRAVRPAGEGPRTLLRVVFARLAPGRRGRVGVAAQGRSNRKGERTTYRPRRSTWTRPRSVSRRSARL